MKPILIVAIFPTGLYLTSSSCCCSCANGKQKPTFGLILSSPLDEVSVDGQISEGDVNILTTDIRPPLPPEEHSVALERGFICVYVKIRKFNCRLDLI